MDCLARTTEAEGPCRPTPTPLRRGTNPLLAFRSESDGPPNFSGLSGRTEVACEICEVRGVGVIDLREPVLEENADALDETEEGRESADRAWRV